MGHMGISTLSVEELIRERRSVRAFREEPLPAGVVMELLLDAIWAPSPHNSQPWRFTAIFQNTAKERLADAMATQLATELKGDGLDPPSIERQTGRSRSRISSAPAVVLCSLVRDGLVRYPDQRRNELEWRMAVQSVGAVLQTLFLLAEARGIGTCWMAAPMYCADVVRATLRLPPTYEPQALVLMGYPAHPGKVRERRSLDELIELR